MPYAIDKRRNDTEIPAPVNPPLNGGSKSLISRSSGNTPPPSPFSTVHPLPKFAHGQGFSGPSRRTATTAASTLAAPSPRQQRLARARLAPLVLTSSTKTIVEPTTRRAAPQSALIRRPPRRRPDHDWPTCVGSHPRRSSGAHRHPVVWAIARPSTRAWSIPRCQRRKRGEGIGTRSGTKIGEEPEKTNSAFATSPRRRPKTSRASGHRPYFAAATSVPSPPE